MTLKPASAHLSVADFDDDGDQDIYYGSLKSDGNYAHFLLVNDLGMFKESGESAGLDHSGWGRAFFGFCRS